MDSIFGLVLVAAVFVGIAWGVSRLMGRSERNGDAGGYDASNSGGNDF